MDTDPTALRIGLCRTGYTPIPLYGKEPPPYGKNNKAKGLAGWPQLGDVSSEQIQMWARTWQDAINTGVLTRTTPTLDIDILNEEAARANRCTTTSAKATRCTTACASLQPS